MERKKAKDNFKIHDVTDRQEIITIHILPSISRSKGNKTMKFGQLTDYSMRNNLFKDHTQNMVEGLHPDPFIKTSESTL